jgi:ribosome-associated heat shock protein Hsp15
MEIAEQNHVRIDKWLWAVRIFKTRSMATNACKSGKIVIAENPVKPSHIAKIGEEVKINGGPFGPITRTFIVKGLLEKRVSAKIAKDFVEETTPEEEFIKLKALREYPFALRERGTGRPTKKERRITEKLKGY